MNKERLNYAVLKCITQIPLTLEEVQLIESCETVDIITEAGIDSYMLDRVKTWARHESRRLSTNFGSKADCDPYSNPYPAKMYRSKPKK